MCVSVCVLSHFLFVLPLHRILLHGHGKVQEREYRRDLLIYTANHTQTRLELPPANCSVKTPVTSFPLKKDWCEAAGGGGPPLSFIKYHLFTYISIFILFS